MNRDMNQKKKLHIVFGTLENDSIKNLSDALVSKGYEPPHIVKKTLKESILKYLTENRDVDVLIVQEYMESRNGYQVNDYAKCLDIIDNLIIIPILTEERKNTNYVNEMYKQQILTALFSDANINNIVQLIAKGRSRVEARDYYGVDLKLTVEDSTDYDACITYILHDGEPDNLHDRIDYIKNRVSSRDFGIIINRLPEDIITKLKGFDEYSDLLEETGKKKPPSNLINDSKKKEETYQYQLAAVNQSLQEAIKKVVIGFTGVQTHIGTTYQALSFAHYLSEKKYKVAVVEDMNQEHLTFQYLSTNKEAVRKDIGFNYKGIDYFPNFDLSYLPKVMLGDYNFVLIDFGLYRAEIIHEFNRCVIPIVVSGSKVWEMPLIDRVFGLVDDEDLLNSYHYLFTFASSSAKKMIKKNMGALNKVFFADFILNPATGEGYQAMEQMLSHYLPVLEEKEKGEKPFSFFKRLFD